MVNQDLMLSFMLSGITQMAYITLPQDLDLVSAHTSGGSQSPVTSIQWELMSFPGFSRHLQSWACAPTQRYTHIHNSNNNNNTVKNISGYTLVTFLHEANISSMTQISSEFLRVYTTYSA